MSLLDSLIGAATGGQSANKADAVGGLNPQMLMGLVTLLMNNAGGLSGLLSKLQQSGLGDAVQSWMGSGTNQSVSPSAMGNALGPDLMGMIARQLGGSQEQAAGTMADLLPGLIDQLTPKGELPADNGLGALGSLMGGGAGKGGLDASSLVGMLGGLMGKR